MPLCSGYEICNYQVRPRQLVGSEVEKRGFKIFEGLKSISSCKNCYVCYKGGMGTDTNFSALLVRPLRRSTKFTLERESFNHKNSSKYFFPRPGKWDIHDWRLSTVLNYGKMLLKTCNDWRFLTVILLESASYWTFKQHFTVTPTLLKSVIHLTFK